ncbi:cupin domain-containing protein [Ensifer adhaerens]|uniref:cupin domain-containing protein n=1 Tax=Ensifer adhaerens TaxID=106592 RepID=UPI00080730F1|nr:cupin domain-containing protein [Ensifer adhaerens]
MSKVIKLGRNGVGLRELEKCSVVPPEAILSGFADELGDVHFESSDKAVVIGTWQSTPYAEMLSYPDGSEYSVILSGKVAITNPDGSIETFSAGESYVLPAGVEVRFEVLETMRKVYVLYTAPAAK